MSFIKAFLLFFIVIISIFFNSIVIANSDKQVVVWNCNDNCLINKLKDLKPLQKVHYSWSIPNKMLVQEENSLLREYARITHAICLSGENANLEQINVAVSVCKNINNLNPSIPCTIAINYSPWHHKFDKHLPPTDFGESHMAEVDAFETKLNLINKMLIQANLANKSNINISAIILDTERFKVKGNNTNWNNAITRKHNIIYNIAKNIFPFSRIIQYERGGWIPAENASGWMQSEWYTLKEKGESFSVSLYRIVELADTRESFKRTFLNAQKHGFFEVIPFIAIGSGMRRKTNMFNQWSSWDYDLVYSWQIGAELNNKWYSDRPNRFAPWDAAKVIVFFPGPFSNNYPFWAKHFIAYVRGANNNPFIEDLE